MSALKTLLDHCMAGSARQRVWPEAGGALGDLLAQIAASDATPQRQLLQAAGAAGLCARSGFVPPASPALPAACATDPLPAPASAFVRDVLQPLLQDGSRRLQHEAFVRMAECGLRLPVAVLPAALEVARRDSSLRPALVAVLGTRGAWLAALNSVWNFAAAPNGGNASFDDVWESGGFEQRRAALATLRASDPGTAREKLSAALGSLPARERSDLLALLSHRLSADDEAFVDALLADRSKEVRQTAAQLLMRLPESRHARAIGAEVAALVRRERGILGSKLVIDAPTAASEAWAAEGIDPVRPTHESLGERAWWLFQLVRGSPLAWWTTHTGLAPEELLKWSSKSEWREALQRGWYESFLVAPDAAWGTALLAQSQQDRFGGRVQAIVSRLPASMRETHWLESLEEAGRSSESARMFEVLGQICGDCAEGSTVSPAFSHAIRGSIERYLAAAPEPGYMEREVLREALCILHPRSLADAAAWPSPAGDTASAAEFRQALLQIISMRRSIAALTATQQPSPGGNP